MSPDQQFQLWLVVVSVIGGGVVGFASTMAVQWLEKQVLAPKLRLTFDDCLTPAAFDGGMVLHAYARVRVENVKPRLARSCRAYLVGVETWDSGSQQFRPTDYRDNLQLIWAYRPSLDAVDIPKGAPQYADVVMVDRSQRTGIIPQFQCIDTPLQYEQIFRLYEKYRLTVVVTGDETPPACLTFELLKEGPNRFPQIATGHSLAANGGQVEKGL